MLILHESRFENGEVVFVEIPFELFPVGGLFKLKFLHSHEVYTQAVSIHVDITSRVNSVHKNNEKSWYNDLWAARKKGGFWVNASSR